MTVKRNTSCVNAMANVRAIPNAVGVNSIITRAVFEESQ